MIPLGGIKMRLLTALALATALIGPSISRADPPPVEDYGRLPAVDKVRLSPLGDRYAFVADNGKARRFYVATTDNKPLEAFNIGNVKIEGVSWAGEDFVLLQTSMTVSVGMDWAVSKQELSTVLVLNLRTHKVVQVFADQGIVDNVVVGNYGAAEVNGRWYGYFGGFTLEQGRDGNARHANMETESSEEWVVADLYRVRPGDRGSEPGRQGRKTRRELAGRPSRRRRRPRPL